MKTKRMEEIEDLVLKSGSLSFEDLQKEFGVSLNTLRRDINELVKNGNIKKVYGGVSSVSNKLIDYEVRNTTNLNLKKKIGLLASPFIQNGDIIFIDSGTTVVHILDFLDKNINCTILTNNLDVINFCAQRKNIELHILGSLYKHKTRSFIDLSPSQDLADINITKAFMAASGVNIQNGLTNSDILEQKVKQSICQKARQIYLMVDHTKFGKTSLTTYAALKDIHTIITDKKLSDEFTSYFNQNNIQMIY